jgi:phage protein U
MFRNRKWIVAIEKLELGTFGGEGEKMQFDSLSRKNALRHKNFERLNSNKKQFEMV